METGGGVAGIDKVVGEPERRFVQLGPDSVTTTAESIGVSGLSPGVARALAEDVSYRVREVSSLCAQFLKHGKRRKLTADDMNRALYWSNVEPVLGYCGGKEVSTSILYQYIPESEIFVARDWELDLVELSQEDSVNSSGEMELDITASWLAVEGSNSQTSLSPTLYQYYSAVVSHVLGDSESLCTTILQDIRTNKKIAPLLPYLVTFLRQGMKKFAEKPQLSIRLLRLMSSIFSNPFLNLSPKPYLSHLVTALLTTILSSISPNSSVVHFAGNILCSALSRWATPVNQLQSQTLRHLREFVSVERSGGGGVIYQVSPQTQYGALTTLTTLGPTVLCESLSPWPQQLSDQLTSGHTQQGSQLWGAVLRAGTAILNYWLSNPEDCSPSWELYGELYVIFGDSMLQELKFLYSDQSHNSISHSKLSEQPGRLRLRKLQIMGQDRRHQIQGESSQPSLLTASQNFDYLADMGVPSDIFEPITERDNLMDESLYKHQQQMTNVTLSYRVMETFPYSCGRCLKARPVPIKLPFRHWGSEMLRRKWPGSGCLVKTSSVPWRQVGTGGRLGTAARRRQQGISRVPNYINYMI